MRGSRTAIMAILLLAVLCFISLPVFSSENPWDADGGTGRGSSNDSTVVPSDSDGNAVVFRAAVNPGGSAGTDLFAGFLWTVSWNVAAWFEFNFNYNAAPVRVETSRVRHYHKQVQRNVE